MADNGSANRAANRRYRQAQHAGRPLIDETGHKSNKFANAGAVAGGFVGALGGSMVPPINVTVNNNKRGSGSNGRRSHAEALLPAPDFTSPAQVRNYCNTLRAAAVTLSIEVAMGTEILKGVLAAVPDPEGRAFGSRIRAAKVARKMNKAADDLRSAAKNAAACYATFQQEFEEEINRVRHRARKPKQPVMNWDQQ
ncbi:MULTISPECIES: plasmid transfer protein TraA [Streptomyces]|uniref:Sporulation protein SsgA n=1 Tax=Streptomyces koelreuteriae TaxID=2838015 RepID=A0ABX8FUV5_9ACTN|nr:MULTISPECIES: plasmid transfer protein TraA [Streptomyces]QWB24795.1 sporulation protein SsgA [Streptomyces koelreuteriae]UUA07812.1 sporulation protein SsgA [Streptomyces koelreuteriae]UUA15441.1 sporulation protein SsgA [Streptomyces sp. CRCS-T-1]